jgi:hypothetical protein
MAGKPAEVQLREGERLKERVEEKRRKNKSACLKIMMQRDVDIKEKVCMEELRGLGDWRLKGGRKRRIKEK